MFEVQPTVLSLKAFPYVSVVELAGDKLLPSVKVNP